MKNLLLVRTDKIGDLVLATPCLQAVKEAWPSCFVAFLAGSRAAPVLEGNPYLDELLVYGDGPNDMELLRHLRGRNFEAAVCLFPTLEISWLLYKAKIPIRVASGFHWYQWLYNRRVYLRRSRCLKREWEYNLDLLRPLGWEGRSRCPSLYLSHEEQMRAKREAERKGWPEKFVAIYPGGGDEIRWSASHFRHLVDLIKAKGMSAVVFWGPGEEDLARGVAGEVGVVAPPTDLRQLMSFLSLSEAMVSNNTGPMHIGAALGLPMVQIFDPRWACNPVRWGHEGPGKKILVPPVPHCYRCSPRCDHYPCMNMITPDEVMTALEEVLQYGRN